MLGADAADIGYAIAKYKNEGYDDVKINLRCDGNDLLPEDDTYIENGVMYSRYINHLNENRIIPEYVSEVFSTDINLLNDKSAVKYDKENSELHIPVESTYITDNYDHDALASYVLQAATANDEGKVLVCIDNFNKDTYADDSRNAESMYEEAASRLDAYQGYAPYYRIKNPMFY